MDRSITDESDVRWNVIAELRISARLFKRRVFNPIYVDIHILRLKKQKPSAYKFQELLYTFK